MIESGSFRFEGILGAVLLASNLCLLACGPSVSRSRLNADLEGQIGTMADLALLSEGEVRFVPDARAELFEVPFQAKVAARETLRNYVQYAREGKYHREYVGWVKSNSLSESGRDRLRVFSLLANLSRAPWYDLGPGETFEIQGALRYRRERDDWKFEALVDGP